MPRVKKILRAENIEKLEQAEETALFKKNNPPMKMSRFKAKKKSTTRKSTEDGLLPEIETEVLINQMLQC